MNIYDQLQAVEDRYEELGELLSDPDVVSDTKRFMALSKEEANTRETVTVYREYKQILQNIEDAEEMIKDAGGDPELEEMAKEELKDSKASKEEYEEKLKILLLPKDPNDDKNIILEIRGAAGGDLRQYLHHYPTRHRQRGLEQHSVDGRWADLLLTAGAGDLRKLPSAHGVRRAGDGELKSLPGGAAGQGMVYRLPAVRRLVFPAEVMVLLLCLPSILSRRIWNGGNGISMPCSRKPARIS